MHKLVLLRHGESGWNRENRFTGWTDVDLSPQGVEEARAAGRLLKAEGYAFDLAYTSVLKRAIRTLNLALEELDQLWIPVAKDWRLNERHYGALQGLNKAETAARFGEAQVLLWRRSYDTPPPPLEPGDPRHEARDRRYLGTAGPAIANPLAVFETPESERFYLRTPVAYDAVSGRVTFFGAVPEGATVQITVAAPDEIFNGATASIADALATFPAGGTPEAALLYSCATRRYLLGTRAGREIELIRDALGPAVPIAGLYCMGEIAPMTPAGPALFHNATMVSVLLGEEPGVGPAA